MLGFQQPFCLVKNLKRDFFIDFSIFPFKLTPKPGPNPCRSAQRVGHEIRHSLYKRLKEGSSIIILQNGIYSRRSKNETFIQLPVEPVGHIRVPGSLWGATGCPLLSPPLPPARAALGRLGATREKSVDALACATGPTLSQHEI